jgi:hypothetical protein
VTDFVDQCRQEWKRLHVPDPVANEMATDLAADLAEAEAEGVSADEVLGRSALDPRSFAAAWATERGVIPPMREKGRSYSRRPLALASVTTLFVLGLIAAALVKLTSGSGPEAVWVAAPGPLPRPVPSMQPPFGVHAGDARTLGWILLLVAMVAIILATWLWATWIRSRRTVTPA